MKVSKKTKGRPSQGKPRAKAYLLTYDELQVLTTLVLNTLDQVAISAKKGYLDPDIITFTRIYSKLTKTRKA